MTVVQPRLVMTVPRVRANLFSSNVETLVSSAA